MDELLQWCGCHVVYLLQSTKNARCTYIGYSNNVAQRLRRHNGEIKGGASYTSKRSLQPWRVVCVVTGFQNDRHATKFEWAWKNAHRSRLFKAILLANAPNGDTVIKRAVGVEAKLAVAERVISKSKWFGVRLRLNLVNNNTHAKASV